MSSIPDPGNTVARTDGVLETSGIYTGRKKDYLRAEMDIRNKVEKEKPDLVIKIGRPRKNTNRNGSTPDMSGGPEKGNAAVAAATDPRKHADRDLMNREVHASEEIPAHLRSTEEAEEAVKHIDWKGFNVEKIVNLMCQLAPVLTGIELLPYQLPVMARTFRSILLNDGATISLLMARQSGKSETMAGIIVTCCVILPALARIFPEQLGIYAKGFWVGIYAPTGEQATTLYNRVYMRARGEMAQSVYEDPEVDTGLEKHGCRWKNGSFVFMQSASTKSQIESKSFHLIAVDEAQNVDELVMSKSIEPMVAWTNGTIVMLGTTSEHPCYFYDVISRNRADKMALPPEKHNHFEHHYEEVLKYNVRYQKHIENMLKKHGLHSRYFQMSYCLRWYFEEGLAVSDADLKTHAMHIRVGLTRYTDAPVVVGIDLARKRNASVVTVGQLMRTEILYDEDGMQREVERLVYVKVCDWLEIETATYPDQRAMMKSFLEPYTNIRYICVDSTGAGDAVFQEMCAEWSFTHNMEAFIFSPKSKNYLMTLFYEFLWKNRIIIPSTDEVRSLAKWQRFYLQMVNLEKVTRHGYTYLTKGHRENSRDDYADSLFLMLHAARMSIQHNGSIEVNDGGIFTGTARQPQSKYRGLEGIRAAVRDGTYGVNRLRDKRAERLADKLMRI